MKTIMLIDPRGEYHRSVSFVPAGPNRWEFSGMGPGFKEGVTEIIDDATVLRLRHGYRQMGFRPVEDLIAEDEADAEAAANDNPIPAWARYEEGPREPRLG